MKFGIEVEGRFKGIKTIFMDQNEIVDNLNLQLFKLFNANALYISDLNDELTFKEITKLYKISEKYLVSIETTSKRLCKYKNFHIILRIDNSDFFKLKNTDQIKFEHCKSVYTITKENMFKTKPKDFNNDKEI